MKTLSEQVNEIKSMKAGLNAKKAALVKLGLTKYEVDLFMADVKANTPAKERMTFTFGVEIECLIHMRLATHGSVCKYNCHPFRAGNVWFMHNGILNIEPVEDRTGSETAFLQKIYPVIQKYGFNSMEAEKTINSVIGCSRFAFMHNGKVSLYGSYQKLNGVYYSNMRWALNNKLTFGIMFENKA